MTYVVQQRSEPGSDWRHVSSHDSAAAAFEYISREVYMWGREVSGMPRTLRVVDTRCGLEVIWPYLGWEPPANLWKSLPEWRTVAFDGRRDRAAWVDVV